MTAVRRLALVGLLALAGSLAFAQTFGEITGTITDSSGAVIPGAQVTVTNVDTGATRTVQTNEAGAYTVPFLNPGVYNITAELGGSRRRSCRTASSRSATFRRST